MGCSCGWVAIQSNRTQTATASGLYSFLMTYHKRHLEYYVCKFHLSSAAPNCPGPWKPQKRKRKKHFQGMHLLGFRDACFSPHPSGIGCQLSRLRLGPSSTEHEGPAGQSVLCDVTGGCSRFLIAVTYRPNMKHLGYSDVYG